MVTQGSPRAKTYLVVLTLTPTILTLGLFLLGIDTAMFSLEAAMFEGFWSTILGLLSISITGGLESWFIGLRGPVEVLVQRSP